MKLSYFEALLKVLQALRTRGLTPRKPSQIGLVTDAIGHVMGRQGQEKFDSDEQYSGRKQRQLVVVFDTLSSLLAAEQSDDEVSKEVSAAVKRCLDLLPAVQDQQLLHELDYLMNA